MSHMIAWGYWESKSDTNNEYYTNTKLYTYVSFTFLCWNNKTLVIFEEAYIFYHCSFNWEESRTNWCSAENKREDWLNYLKLFRLNFKLTSLQVSLVRIMCQKFEYKKTYYYISLFTNGSWTANCTIQRILVCQAQWSRTAQRSLDIETLHRLVIKYFIIQINCMRLN